jgi:Reverse transcriptase (RNA-dependent DNA polymerase)
MSPRQARPSPQWLEMLDLNKAVRNLRREVTGDWYRDPWGWPEWTYVADSQPELVSQHLNSTTVGGRLALLDVPKENYGIRPASIMGPLDRITYEALVGAVSKLAIGPLPPWVFGWRLDRNSPTRADFVRNGAEWQTLQDHLFELSKIVTHGLRTDLTSFFASVTVPRISESFDQLRITGPVAERIEALLTHWDGTPHRQGLPQRSTASAVLANMYLASFDRVLQRHIELMSRSAESSRPMASRWMDDVWVLAFNEATLRSVQIQLIYAARDLGLELHMGKTEVLEGDNLVEALGRLHMSGVDHALMGDRPDFAPLNKVFEEALCRPSSTERSLVRFITVRLRRKKRWEDIRRLIDIAPHMPHAADHLGRAFRDAGIWKDLEEWFLDYCRGPWSMFPWSQAQLAMMFPTRMRASNDLIEMLAGWISPGAPADRMAVAIQRLSRWAPGALTDLIDTHVSTANHPFERRLLGLACAGLRMGTSKVRSYLSSYPELAASDAMMRNEGAASLKIVNDFDMSDTDSD